MKINDSIEYNGEEIHNIKLEMCQISFHPLLKITVFLASFSQCVKVSMFGGLEVTFGG